MKEKTYSADYKKEISLNGNDIYIKNSIKGIEKEGLLGCLRLMLEKYNLNKVYKK